TVDQHHRAGALATRIPAECGALPIDPQIAGVLGVERALAIAQSADEGAACLLAEDVAVGLAPLAHRPLDDGCKAAGDAAEEAVTGVDQFARRKSRFGRGRGRRALRTGRDDRETEKHETDGEKADSGTHGGSMELGAAAGLGDRTLA